MKKTFALTRSTAFYILVLLLCSITGYGQQPLGGQDNSSITDLPQVIPPSPTVANLMHFEEVPVDTYTGQPNIALPLFSKNMDGGLAFSLSLNYNTQGIRIDERSGWTGTGWSLFAGGTISRTVLGVNDDEYILTPGIYAPGEVGSFHSGYYKQMKYLRDFQSGNVLINPNGSDFQDYQNFLWNTAYGPQTYDYQPDLFQFNFVGYSGRFIVVNNNGTLKPILISSSQKVKIELSHDRNTFEISSFTVVAPNGYKFVFDQKEITKTQNRKSGVDQSGNALDSAIQAFKEISYTSSWHLSRIKSPSDFTVCSFNYQDVWVHYNTQRSTQTATTRNSPSVFNTYFDRNNPNAGFNASLVPPARLHTWNILQVSTKKLKEVTFRDGTKVAFTLSPNKHPEQDNATGCILDKAEVFDVGGVKNKEFVFTYKTTRHNRLFLMNVAERSGASTLNYKLNYNNEEGLPGYGSGAKDQWGYYKFRTLTRTGLQFNPGVLNPGGGIATTGVLTGITYPTGGRKEFIFEPHEFSFLGDVLVDPKDIEANYQDITAINNTTLRHNPINPSINSSDILLNIPNDTGADVTISGLTGNDESIGYHFLEFVPANSSLSTIRIRDLKTRSHSISLKQGSYVVRLKSLLYLPDGSSGSPEVSLRTTVSYTKYLGPVVKHKTGGGLRIQEIRFTEGLDQKTKISYNYPLLDSATLNAYNISGDYSSGSFDGALGMTRKSIKNVTALLRGSNVGGLSGRCSGNIVSTSFLVKQQGNTVEASLTKGNYVGYKNVEVYQDNNGKNVMSYTNAIDYPSYDARFYEDIIPAQYNNPEKDLDFKRGNLLERTGFDKNGRIIEKTTNQYDYKILDSEKYFFKYSENEPCASALAYKGETYQNYKSLSAQESCIPCGDAADFIGIGTAYYDYGLPFLKETTVENYFYDEAGNQKKTTTNTRFNYSLRNYQPTTVVTRNSKGEILTSRTQYAHDVNNARLLSEHRIVEPIKVETTKGALINVTKLSTQNTTYKDFGNGLYLPQNIQTSKGNQGLDNRVVFHKYDAKGNPVEVSKKDGSKIYYVWGYNSTQPIAKIEGYTSINSTQQNLINAAITASNSDVSTATENTLRTKLNAIRNGFSAAQVTTFSYDPIVGVTSITDPRGEILFYEYDEFNRLSLIKNTQGDILEQHNYNYKN